MKVTFEGSTLIMKLVNTGVFFRVRPSFKIKKEIFFIA